MTRYFKVPVKTLQSIQNCWNCKLLANEDLVKCLEYYVLNLLLDLEATKPPAPAEEVVEWKKKVKKARKRHAAIARKNSELLQLLLEDDRDDPPLRLRKRRQRTGQLIKLGRDGRVMKIDASDVVDAAISSARNIIWFASLPLPERIEELTAPSRFAPTGEKLREPLRAQWNAFIERLAMLYTLLTGRHPTANRDAHTKDNYSSQFLSGLYELYEVLPDDLHKTASRQVLGSRAHEYCRRHRAKLKR